VQNRRHLFILHALLASLVISAPGSAVADLVPRDDAQFGSGALTLDTRTGLTWLDVPFSAGLSYDQVVAAMQPGEEFQGFRYATAQEVFDLFTSAGIPPPGDYNEAQIGPQVSNFISLVGTTSSNEGRLEVTGISGTKSPENTRDAFWHCDEPAANGGRTIKVSVTRSVRRPTNLICGVPKIEKENYPKCDRLRY
jgi:hypothetical protein